MNDKAEEEGDRGFALLAVLGFMLLFAMVLAPFAAASRIRALTTSYEYDRARLESASEAINGYLAWRLANDASWRRSVETGGMVSVDCSIGDVIARIALVPHAGLIHLNGAEEPLLKAGFAKIGFSSSEAEDLAAKVVRFRAPRPLEGEVAAGVDGGFKHAPFEDIAELHDFEALRKFSLSDLARVFSAQSGRAIFSAVDESSGFSEVYTLETTLFDGSARGGDAAVFGDAAAGSRRLATIEAGSPAQPERVGSCTPLLGPETASLLAEVLA